MVLCYRCGKSTRNQKYCSRTCANTVNGNLYPSRTRMPRFCKKCKVEVPGRRTVCDSCSRKVVDWHTVTLGSLRDRALQQYAAQIRNQARLAYQRSGRPTECAVCGYSRHVEICHIRAISQFEPTASVAEVNKLENLVALCPNHHWEFDNDLLASEYIASYVATPGIEPRSSV